MRSGEIYCLLGANGAGKTTAINLFLHFIRPNAGVARINGVDVTQAPLDTKRDVAYIPEMVSLYPTLTGLENLSYFAALATGVLTPKERLLELLDQVGLDRAAVGRRVRGYSKGMRQKVWIAVAMAKQARALLLDSPRRAGPSRRGRVRFAAARCRGSGCRRPHNHARPVPCWKHATRMGIMKAGRLVEDLSGSQVRSTDLQAMYLRHMRG
ncbi:ABC transporter ATP-binding protein NatA [Xylophilus ampelinus]|nr:ABC transporter ATP-binding protein NatA [Xylophilus ampelinus]